MNKKSIQKLRLFMMGLQQRITDNKDFVKGIDIDFKSGNKVFKAQIKLEEERLKMNFNGSTSVHNVEELPDTISSISSKYESISINYMERGTTIIIEGDSNNVKMRTEETEKTKLVAANEKTSNIRNREYLIKVGQADDLLKEIGILGQNGKVKNDMIRKYNQIDHFVELIDDMLKDLADKHETINILDCGCGKSYLTFVLNYYIKEVLKKNCYFIGLDYSDTVINASKIMAENLGYNNMNFKVTDIKNYSADRKIHMLISLHACDTATDQAIALGIRNNVESMVVVPCCHREILSQYSYEHFESIIKHGILKARMADVITDGMRALFIESFGYKVSVLEYISPLETPKNLMIKALKSKTVNKSAASEYDNLKKLFGINPTMDKLV